MLNGFLEFQRKFTPLPNSRFYFSDQPLKDLERLKTEITSPGVSATNDGISFLVGSDASGYVIVAILSQYGFITFLNTS